MAQIIWEYEINLFRVLAMTDLTTAHHLDDFNIRGAEGWELCGFTTSSARSNDAQTNETRITCVWKRRKTGEQPQGDVLWREVRSQTP